MNHSGCLNCGIPSRTQFCDCCQSLLDAVSRPFFVAAHRKWEKIMKKYEKSLDTADTVIHGT